MTLLESLCRRLEASEGRSHTKYLCTENHWTIGVGFNLERGDARRLLAQVGADLDAVMVGAPITDEQIDQLLAITARQAIAEASAIVRGWTTLPPAMQMVLIDLVFNMGAPRVMKFVQFRAAVEAHDWKRAADELVDSKWYHQVGDRSKRIVAEVEALAGAGAGEV